MQQPPNQPPWNQPPQGPGPQNYPPQPPGYGYQGYPNGPQYYQGYPAPRPSSGMGTVLVIIGVIGAVVLAGGAAAVLLMKRGVSHYDYERETHQVIADVPATTDTPTPKVSAASRVSAGPLDGWVSFKSAGGKYEVMMPSTPNESTTPISTVAGDVEIHMAMVADDATNTAYAVSYNDFVINLPDTKDAREAAVNGALTKSGSTIEAHHEIKVAGHNASEGVGTQPQFGHVTAISFSVGHRQYQIAIFGVSDQAKIDALVGSFKLTK